MNRGVEATLNRRHRDAPGRGADLCPRSLVRVTSRCLGPREDTPGRRYPARGAGGLSELSA